MNKPPTLGKALIIGSCLFIWFVLGTASAYYFINPVTAAIFFVGSGYAINRLGNAKPRS